jgi:hypothetical protein
MRILEVSLISLFSIAIMLNMPIPIAETSYYEQQHVLANDVFIYLYKETNGTLYYRESYDGVKELINNISKELSLCIYFNNSYYEIKTCEIKEGSFIESNQPYGRVIIGIGK